MVRRVTGFWMPFLLCTNVSKQKSSALTHRNSLPRGIVSELGKCNNPLEKRVFEIQEHVLFDRVFIAHSERGRRTMTKGKVFCVGSLEKRSTVGTVNIKKGGLCL